MNSDFVTNNYSLSFIITMHKNMVETYEKLDGEYRSEEKKRITGVLKKEILETGTRIYLENKEIYAKRIDFNHDDGTTIDHELLEARSEKLNFSEINDDKLWDLIKGEYILKGTLGTIEGFGVTQVGGIY